MLTHGFRGGHAAAPPFSPWTGRRRRPEALLLLALALAGCAGPRVRDLPARRPLPADSGRVASVAVVTHADSVDPARVSDGTLCPHADRRRFARYFSVPEEVLAQELTRAGYPVTRLPASGGPALLSAYPARVWIAFVGDSRCETRVPLFGPRRITDCSVRVTVAAAGGDGGARRFDRTGESSLSERVEAFEESGPTPAWEGAVRDAVRQVLEDRVLARMLQAPGAPLP